MVLEAKTLVSTMDQEEAVVTERSSSFLSFHAPPDFTESHFYALHSLQQSRAIQLFIQFFNLYFLVLLTSTYIRIMYAEFDQKVCPYY